MRRIKIFALAMFTILTLVGCAEQKAESNNDMAIEKLKVVTSQMNPVADKCDDCKLTSYYCQKHYEEANKILATLENEN